MFSTLSEEKSRQKMTNSLASNEFFCQLFFSVDDHFCQRVIFTDKYSYQHLFYKQKQFVLSTLKMPLVYLFDFKFDKNFWNLTK